jgi:ribosome biogenesis protein ENP2
VGCSSNEVYRLNLEQGRFMKPLVTDFVDGVNVCALNQWNGLYAFGGGEGVVEFYDSRSKSRVAKFSPFAQSLEEGDVTALTFLNDQLSYAVGNSSGEVSIFDLRSSAPVIKRRHFSETPIISIHEHSISDNIVSADKKSIRVWNKKTGETFCAYEPEHDLNDLLVVPKSGMIMTANEGTFMNVLFVPSLGPAPKFCTFLDNLTEELEEPSAQAAQAGVFDDYKFVTKKELEQLSLDHLIGTNVLRAYMHGFFIDNRLYEKAKILFSFQASGVGLGGDWKKELIKKKMEEEAASRISSGTKLPKVNKNLAKKILDNKTSDEANIVEDEGANNLVDDRFKDLFKDPLFEIDEDNAEFVKFNTRPKEAKKSKKPSETEQNADNMQDEAEGVNSSDDDSVFGETVEIQRYGKKADKTKNRKEFSWDNRPRKANKKDNRTFADRIKKHSRTSKSKTSSRSTDGAMSMSFRVKSRK